MPQSNSGTITLYSKHGEVLLERTYVQQKQRAQFLSQWRYAYGKNFNSMYYHIIPTLASVDAEMELRIQEANRMKKEGKSFRQIAKALGVKSMYYWMNKTA